MMEWRDNYGRITSGRIKKQWKCRNAIKLVQGQARTLRDAFESRYGERMENNSPMIPWMIIHAAAIMSRFKVGKDGKTPLQNDKRQKLQKSTDRIWRMCDLP